MRVLGMISGTSHDGIDVAVVDFRLQGDLLRASIEHTDSVPYDAGLRRRLLDALPPAAVDLGTVCELDVLVGQAFAAAADAALEHCGPVDAISSHGQTVFHWVEQGRARGTLQLGQPAWIAERTGLPVLSDLRAADVAAGGQGAPLVALLDRLLLAEDERGSRTAGALNLGGIANMTVCGDGRDVVAWDIGPANALIDAIVTADPSSSDAFDRDGALALRGTVDGTLLEVLLAEPYYRLPAPKSSGKELFHLRYVQEALQRSGTRPGLPDLVATLVELTAVTVRDAVQQSAVELLVASGGGVRNPALMARIRALLPAVEVVESDRFGVPAADKEAIAFALLGWTSLHGLPGNVPTCTGASGPRVLGRLTPAPDGRTPPAPRLDRPPAALVFDGGER